MGCTPLHCGAVVFVYFLLPSSVLVTSLVCSASPVKSGGGWGVGCVVGTKRDGEMQELPITRHHYVLDGFTCFGGRGGAYLVKR